MVYIRCTCSHSVDGITAHEAWTSIKQVHGTHFLVNLLKVCTQRWKIRDDQSAAHSTLNEDAFVTIARKLGCRQKAFLFASVDKVLQTWVTANKAIFAELLQHFTRGKHGVSLVSQGVRGFAQRCAELGPVDGCMSAKHNGKGPNS